MNSTSVEVRDIKLLAPSYTYSTKLPITSIDFSCDGLEFVASTIQKLFYYRITPETPKPNEVNVEKSGSDIVAFIASSKLILHSSTRNDNSICLLNHEMRQYDRFFPGHSGKVFSISPSPTNQTFLSSSEDSTIRYWDCRQQERVEIIKTDSPSFVNFHPIGFTYAAAIGSSIIQVYDLRNLKQHTIEFKLEKGFDLTGLKYSDDGQTLLISTRDGTILTTDINKHCEAGRFSGYKNINKQNIEACFVTFSKFIASGSSNGRLHFWNVATGEKVATMRGHNQTDTIQCTKFNRQYMMMATASDTKLTFWIENI